ncbi:hypothetical protein KZZ52_33770 [Dactylosporangium sp. AC04546]|uniref:hypothetical protein n=1 Tax=Dactylosporangium sp. AC04546 TaxID=2862460 RepID=UPI001EDE1F45|nr:hypothetical protein [Dactylosporangium sp. AC04546]WVK78944.1 hypothetical protein KZZ52_33770 [Dactylosporangium sp. AC04546]
MLQYDPTITAIAVATNDALVEHLWRFDTATTNGADPVAHIAVALCHAAEQFNTTADRVGELLDRIGGETVRGRGVLAGTASIMSRRLESDMMHLTRQLERLDAHRAALLTLYHVWRSHRRVTAPTADRHLLVHPYDPTGGMVRLTIDAIGTIDTADNGGPYDPLGAPSVVSAEPSTWLVTPDHVAAAAFGLPTYGTVLGAITLDAGGWRPTPFAHVEQHTTTRDGVGTLGIAHTEDAACAELLAWWSRHLTHHHARHTHQIVARAAVPDWTGNST